MTHLLHPRLIRAIPITGRHITTVIDGFAASSAANVPSKQNITVAIRAFNEAAALANLLTDITHQSFTGQIEIVVVDNESSDNTAAVAKQFGAKVVTLPRAEFTYPRSMNLAMESASNDTVFLTVAHASLSHDQLLQAAANHLTDPTIAGAFAYVLPDARASRTERYGSAGYAHYLKQHQILQAGMGAMGATGVLIRRSVWSELGKFDERYQTGGEDGVLAGKILQAGYKIIYDPALAVHHSHGLGPLNTIKQWRHWRKTAAPQNLDLKELSARRPDINFD